MCVVLVRVVAVAVALSSTSAARSTLEDWRLMRCAAGGEGKKGASFAQAGRGEGGGNPPGLEEEPLVAGPAGVSKLRDQGGASEWVYDTACFMAWVLSSCLISPKK